MRLHNVSRFEVLKPGNVIKLDGDRARKITLEVNCSEPTRFDLKQGDEFLFLFKADGYGICEFTSSHALVEIQPTVMSASGTGDVLFFTKDGRGGERYVEAQATYTRVMDRRPRNFEQEMMQYRSEQNIMRLMQKTLEDRLAYEAWKREQEAAVPHDPVTGEVDEPEVPADDQGATGGDGGGEQQVAPAAAVAPAPKRAKANA